MYHDLVDARRPDESGMPGPIAARYKHTEAQFRDHLAAVAATALPVGLVLSDAPWPHVAFTFDDGGVSALLAARLLEDRGWRGHFFVTTSRIGTPGFLSEAEIRLLVERGHSIGSHSHSHPRYMGRLDRSEMDREWRESCGVLAEVIGAPPEIASLPGGFLSRGVVETAAQAGYRILMTSEPSSRPRRAAGIVHLGRYTIWGSTPPATAAAYVRGSRLARGRLAVEWKVKQLSKRTLPGGYRAVQRVRALAARTPVSADC
jgi:peptidoglycan/xylan/chitin deacetylase (PgdA/CDA1 family)